MVCHLETSKLETSISGLILKHGVWLIWKRTCHFKPQECIDRATVENVRTDWVWSLQRFKEKREEQSDHSWVPNAPTNQQAYPSHVQENSYAWQRAVWCSHKGRLEHWKALCEIRIFLIVWKRRPSKRTLLPVYYITCNWMRDRIGLTLG